MLLFATRLKADFAFGSCFMPAVFYLAENIYPCPAFLALQG